MRVFRLPPRALALLFDLDNTLYRNPGYAAFQEDSQVARLAAWAGETVADSRKRLAGARAARTAAGLPKTSMATLFMELGVDMASIVRWREEEVRPGEWLAPDPDLAAAIGLLSSPAPHGAGFRLALLTNNPRSVGLASLKALGLEGLFELVVGLDDTGCSKPRHEPFLKACAGLGLPPEACISVGDREDVDIAPALALGMGAILVDGPEDILHLSQIVRGEPINRTPLPVKGDTRR